MGLRKQCLSASKNIVRAWRGMTAIRPHAYKYIHIKYSVRSHPTLAPAELSQHPCGTFSSSQPHSFFFPESAILPHNIFGPPSAVWSRLLAVGLTAPPPGEAQRSYFRERVQPLAPRRQSPIVVEPICSKAPQCRRPRSPSHETQGA